MHLLSLTSYKQGSYVVDENDVVIIVDDDDVRASPPLVIAPDSDDVPLLGNRTLTAVSNEHIKFQRPIQKSLKFIM